MKEGLARGREEAYGVAESCSRADGPLPLCGANSCNFGLDQEEVRIENHPRGKTATKENMFNAQLREDASTSIGHAARTKKIAPIRSRQTDDFCGLVN